MAMHRLQTCVRFVLFVQLLLGVLAQQCSNTKLTPNYEDVFKPELQRSHGAFLDLPGFTRSRCDCCCSLSCRGIKATPTPHTVEKIPNLCLQRRYLIDHALITPESRVWLPNPTWPSCKTSHLITPASGAHFSMFLARIEVCVMV